MPVFKAMFITTNPIPVKWAMSLIGMDMGPFRLPLVEPLAAEKARIEAAPASSTACLSAGRAGFRQGRGLCFFSPRS